MYIYLPNFDAFNVQKLNILLNRFKNPIYSEYIDFQNS